MHLTGKIMIENEEKHQIEAQQRGFNLERRCNGMDEAWRFAPGRGIWSLHRRCDEARLHFCFAKIRAGTVPSF